MGCACTGAERTEPSNHHETKKPPPKAAPSGNSIPDSKQIRSTPNAQSPVSKGSRLSEGLKIGLKQSTHLRKLSSSLDSLYRIMEQTETTNTLALLKAEYVPTHQLCVIKRLRKSDKPKKDRSIAAAEVEALSQLDHPNIVKVLEGFEDLKYIYICYEALLGPSLTQHLTITSRISEGFAAKIMLQLLSAVSYCHSKEILHGDIHTDNLQFISEAVDENAHVKLKGFSGDLMNALLRQTAKKQKKGSPFVPPEVSEEGFTQKGDVWACGIILLIMLGHLIPKTKMDNQLLCKRTSKPEFLFGGQQFSHVSVEAKKLIAALLNPVSDKRLSADEALQYPWLKIAHEPAKSSYYSKILHNLSPRETQTLLKTAVVKFILTRVVKNDKLIAFADQFSALDINHDGYISLEELVTVLMRVKPEAQARAEAEEILKSADGNLNGQLEYSEFIMSSYCEKNLLSRDNLLLAFNIMDEDSNGKISLKELKKLLEVKEGEESEVAWRMLMAEFDSSGDGEIDFQEFEELMH